MKPDFDSMNETDVREIVVRPLLGRLGYTHGTQANIRTEVPLRYDRAFLGRKNAAKDPPLRGRADYICEAISYGRWVVEAKGANETLTRDDAEQAHTYCAHPEIAATHFLLTNGRTFRLYVTGDLDAPLLEWAYEQTEQHIMTLFNILGPEAVKRRATLIRHDVAKPLGKSLPSKLKIVGGEVMYGEHQSDHPLMNSSAMTGTVGAVTGVNVQRLEDGRIQALVSVRSPYQQLAEINRLAGIGDYEFLTSDEYISTDHEAPTILQNVIEGRLAPGARFTPMPGMAEMVLPFGFVFTVYTEATGYVANGEFMGMLSFDYAYQLIRGRPTGNPQIDHMMLSAPATARVTGTGTFRIIVAQ
jgi:hypothetical protein